MNETLHMLLVLFVASVLSAAALTIVYEKTQPLIEKNNGNSLDLELHEVLPNAEQFEEISFNVSGTNIVQTYKGLSNNRIVGYVFLSRTPGFSDYIKILIGTNKQQITDVKIIENAETPGLGSRITEDSFLSQFRNKDINTHEFDAIAGATISSSAVINAITETESFINKLHEQGKLQ